MKGLVFILTWCLILLAAGYDGYFAWQNRADFANWEVNPVARWIVENGCFELMFALKAVGVAFATIMAIHCHRVRNRLEMPMTVFVACCYLLLAAHYALGFVSPYDARAVKGSAVASREMP